MPRRALSRSSSRLGESDENDDDDDEEEEDGEEQQEEEEFDDTNEDSNVDDNKDDDDDDEEDYSQRHRQRPQQQSRRKRRAANVVDSKKSKTIWTAAEDEALLKAVIEDQQNREAEGDESEEEDWDEIAQSVPGKSPVQCLKRYMMLNQTKEGEDEDEGSSTAPPKKRPRRAAKAKAKEEPSDSPTWSADDIELLRKLVEQYKDAAPRWNEIAGNFPSRNAIDCLTKWQSLSAPPVIKGKGSWTAEEDNILRDKRALYGRKWAKIAAHLPGRQGKQCRERFVNHLDPELKKGEWTDDEEAILIALHQQYGNRWANISKQLPGRSDNDVKNHWYSTIQRKFQQHGKEKLIQAALQQVQMMQQMGTLPAQQTHPPTSWPPGPYSQGTSPHHPPPPYHHPMHPPPYPHSPPGGGPPGYGYPPPPATVPGPVGAPPESSYMYPPHPHMPPPQHPHHHHHHPPPPYYHPHYPRHLSASPSPGQMSHRPSGEGASPSASRGTRGSTQATSEHHGGNGGNTGGNGGGGGGGSDENNKPSSSRHYRRKSSPSLPGFLHSPRRNGSPSGAAVSRPPQPGA